MSGSTTSRYRAFPCHRPLGLLLSKGGHGIFNVRNDGSACCAHEGETGTDESVQVLTQKDRKGHPAATRSRTLATTIHSPVPKPTGPVEVPVNLWFSVSLDITYSWHYYAQLSLSVIIH